MHPCKAAQTRTKFCLGISSHITKWSSYARSLEAVRAGASRKDVGARTPYTERDLEAGSLEKPGFPKTR
ncbi:MAG: hypothetical protein JRJ43_06300 [Deltaproteobacteria bacterium]|nr:hypothetical protein [Deltaproteobacteria bacterium]MBW2349737.1 hypothetical protein [Deltaproteobacteria bacterium]